MTRGLARLRIKHFGLILFFLGPLKLVNQTTTMIDFITQVKNKTPLVATDRQFGCVGNGLADDTQCFIKMRNYAQTNARTNPLTPGDKNAFHFYLPQGIYKVTSPEAMMNSTYTTPTGGLMYEGDGVNTIIEYRPTTTGPLLKNSDAWLAVIFKDLKFIMNNTTGGVPCDWLDTNAVNKSQDWTFDHVYWQGSWDKLFSFTGTNLNSEFKWIVPSFSGTNTNGWVVWGPTQANGGSDQFLNYWFTNLRWVGLTGNFLRMDRGGSISVTNSDFSGNQGSGDINNPNVFFYLGGNVHASGVTSFNLQNTRFELKSQSVKLLYTEWGLFGSIALDNVNTSSQAPFVTGLGHIVLDLNYGNTTGGGVGQGAGIKIKDSSIMGQVRITGNNNFNGWRRLVKFDMTQFSSFQDWSQAFIFTGLSGGSDSNLGSYPIVECENCRGTSTRPGDIYGAWLPNTAFAALTNGLPTRVTSNGYTYEVVTPGTTSTTAPFGRTTSLVDGTVTWKSVDLYDNLLYAKDGTLKADLAVMSAPGGKMFNSALSNGSIFNDLPYYHSISSQFGLNTARLILPINATAVKVTLDILPGAVYNGPSTYTVRTDEYSPTILGTLGIPRLDRGGHFELPFVLLTGTDIGKRTIVLEASNNVLSRATGTAALTYF